MATKDKAVDTGERIKALFAQVEAGVKGVYESDNYRKYLSAMSKFHTYSFRNTLLILAQFPDATRVAGYNAWQDKFNRHVRKGEKGISILGYTPRTITTIQEKKDDSGKVLTGPGGKPETEKVERKVPAFTPVYVFDVSQTEGDLLPQLVHNLEGEVDGFKKLMAALEHVSPFPIQFEEIEGGARGYCNPTAQRIAIRQGMSEAQTIKTAIHEITHAYLHGPSIDRDRHTEEVEAESVAFIVSDHYGIDTSDYSFPSLASWSSGRELAELTASLDTIQRKAFELIEGIDAQLRELTKDRELTQEQPGIEEPRISAPAKVALNLPSAGLTLDPAIQPVVTIIWSESDQLREGEQMPLAKADLLFKQLDAEHGDGYDKTKFSIAFTMHGELDTYEGRQDFGDGDGGLIQHIKAHHEYYAKDESWKNHVLHTEGPEAWENEVAQRDMLLNEFIPYMLLHCNLSELERAGAEQMEMLRALPELDALDQSKIAYYEAMQTYIDDCRHELNTATGEYHLPEMPKEQDAYTPELRAYQEQVREEVRQEAAAAGMTVEEYAANGYEPLSSSQPVQEPTSTPAPDTPEANGMTGEQLPFPDMATEHKEPAKESTPAAPYYSINETTARRAKEAISFFDYRQGSATSEYRQMVDEAVQIAERQKKHVDPMYHEKIDRLLDAYCRKLAANMNHHNEIMGRVPSVMIAGPSNFPVRKKEKQNAAMDSNMQKWREIQGLLDKIRGTGTGGISADDPNAIAKLESKLASLEKSQETMKATNAFYRKHKTLDGCPVLLAEQIQKLTADMQTRWYGRAASHPFEAYSLQNNNAEINRLKKRIEELTHRVETPLTGWEFDGGKVEVNKEDNRLQIFFDEKPDADKRTELKKGGFKWSPTAGAWQRQLNGNAFYATNAITCIQPLTGERPTDLQRAHIRAEKAKEHAEQQLPQDSTHDAVLPTPTEKKPIGIKAVIASAQARAEERAAARAEAKNQMLLSPDGRREM